MRAVSGETKQKWWEREKQVEEGWEQGRGKAASGPAYANPSWAASKSARQAATAEEWAAFSHREKKSTGGKRERCRSRSERRTVAMQQKSLASPKWHFCCRCPCDSIWPPQEMLWLLSKCFEAQVTLCIIHTAMQNKVFLQWHQNLELPQLLSDFSECLQAFMETNTNSNCRVSPPRCHPEPNWMRHSSGFRTLLVTQQEELQYSDGRGAALHAHPHAPTPTNAHLTMKLRSPLNYTPNSSITPSTIPPGA